MNGNKCLKLDKTELGWAAARNVCKEAGADLALVIRMRMMTTMIVMMMMMIHGYKTIYVCKEADLDDDFDVNNNQHSSIHIFPGYNWKAEQRIGRADD